MKREQWQERKKRKIERVLENKRARSGLTPVGQLAALDRRLGKGVGAAKERQRLSKLLSIVLVLLLTAASHAQPPEVIAARGEATTVRVNCNDQSELAGCAEEAALYARIDALMARDRCVVAGIPEWILGGGDAEVSAGDELKRVAGLWLRVATPDWVDMEVAWVNAEALWGAGFYWQSLPHYQVVIRAGGDAASSYGNAVTNYGAADGRYFDAEQIWEMLLYYYGGY